MKTKPKWTVKSEIDDSYAPDNVFTYYWLECEDGEALTIFPDHEPQPDGTDKVKIYLDDLCERLNASSRTEELRKCNEEILTEENAHLRELLVKIKKAIVEDAINWEPSRANELLREIDSATLTKE